MVCMIIRASAPGNLFFFGEYAVLYGKPSICVAVGLRTYVTLSSRTDNKIGINSSVFGLAEGQLNDNFIGFQTKITKSTYSLTYFLLEEKDCIPNPLKYFVTVLDGNIPLLVFTLEFFSDGTFPGINMVLFIFLY